MTTCTDTYNTSGWTGRREVTPVQCVREVDGEGRHRGDHQGWQPMPAGESTLFGEVTRWDAWQKLWTWREGAHGTARGGGSCLHCNGHPLQPQTHDRSAHALIPCTQCGALHDPLGHHLDAAMQQAPDGSCFSCRIWWSRAEQYAGRLPYDKPGMRPVRPHPDSPSFGGTGRLYTWCPGGHGAFGGTRYTVRWDDGAEAGPDDVLWDGGAIPWWWLDAFPPNSTVTYENRVASSTGRRHGRMGGVGGNEWPDYTGSPS